MSLINSIIREQEYKIHITLNIGGFFLLENTKILLYICDAFMASIHNETTSDLSILMNDVFHSQA